MITLNSQGGGLAGEEPVEEGDVPAVREETMDSEELVPGGRGQVQT